MWRRSDTRLWHALPLFSVISPLCGVAPTPDCGITILQFPLEESFRPSLGFLLQEAGNGQRHLSTQWPSWLSFPCSGDARTVRPLALRLPLERPHRYSLLVPWLRQAPREGTPRWQLHLQSQHIKDIGIMLLLLCVAHQKNHLPCASSSRLFTSTMSVSAASSCRLSSANSPVRLATGLSAACT